VHSVRTSTTDNLAILKRARAARVTITVVGVTGIRFNRGDCISNTFVVTSKILKGTTARIAKTKGVDLGGDFT